MLLQPLPPLRGIPRRMEHAVDRHNPIGILVEDRIGESPHEPSAKIPIDLRMHFRRAADRLYAGIDTCEELLTQSGTLALIPAIGVVDIPRGLRQEEKFSPHDEPAPSV